MPDRERKRVPDHRSDDDDIGNNGVGREAIIGCDAAFLQHNAVSLRTKLLHDFHTHNNTAKVTQATKRVKKVAHYYIGFRKTKPEKITRPSSPSRKETLQSFQRREKEREREERKNFYG